MSDTKDIPIYRIAILGVSEVGKTQIVNQFVNNCFNPLHVETFEDIRPYRKLLNLGTDKNPVYCLLVIEDIFPTNHPLIEAGGVLGEESETERIFASIIDNSCEKEKKSKEDKKLNRIYANKQIYGYLFVFDASASPQELTKALKNLEQIIKFINNSESRGVNGDFVSKKIILGNKKEMLSDSELNSIKTNQILKDIGLPVKFVSAKLNEDITTSFQDLGKQIQEDPRISTLEEEWQKEVSEENKEEDKTSAQVKQGQKGGPLGEDEEESPKEKLGDRIILDDEYQKLPVYKPQGIIIDSKGCGIF